jgi:hypothetical protein
VIKRAIFAAIFALTAFSTPVWASEDDVLKKLNDVMTKQNDILQKLDAVQAELQIVKIRATQK